MSEYDPIFLWKMTNPEAETYKIALIWEKEVEKHTPTHLKTPEWRRRNRLPRKRDPRSSHLFRYCWKLRRETRGLLTLEEMPLYILANLTVLRAFNGYMEINTLCGDRAWIRWKIWKRLYDKKLAQVNHKEPPPTIDSKLNRELLRTKKFIYERCEGQPNETKISEFVENGYFKLWVMQGKISMWYVMLSPFVAPYIDKLAQECGFDRSWYEGELNDDTIRFFEYEFGCEFEEGGC